MQLDYERESMATDEARRMMQIRRARLKRLAGVGAVVVVLIAMIAIAAGGRVSPPKPGSSQAFSTEQSISALLANVPQSGDVLGAPSAPVTLEWFGDLECPFCREFTLGALPAIIHRWVQGGELKIEYLSMQTATHVLKVFDAQQIAALAAGLQDKMWNFIETFYHEQGEEGSGYVTAQFLYGLARQIPGLNLTLWRNDRFAPQLAAQIAAERSTVIRDHFSGTPTFLIGHSRQSLYKLQPHSLSEPASFDEAIRYLLGR
jgi:protein-disulfide isomerase